jgi:MinD superfamily P-loop ATPase
MAYAISKDDCILCGACESGCTHGAVLMDGEGLYFIDATKCEDCGECITTCPNDAIHKL